MLTVSTCVSVFPAQPESDACTVKVNLPMAVGVPLSTPLVPRVRPGGVAPPVTVVHVVIPVPPIADNVAWYGLRTLPAARLVVEIAIGCGAMLIVVDITTLRAASDESCAFTDRVNDPNV